MYLSRVELDPHNRHTMQALSKLNQLHGAVESAFPFERTRKLWRIDSLNGKLYLLMVSPDRPNFENMSAQFGTGVEGQVCDYTKLLHRIENKTEWQFRLTACPAKAFKPEGSLNVRGTLRACCSVAEQIEWLKMKASKNGFAVDENSITITGQKWYGFTKGEQHNRVSFLAVTYEGILQVTDADLFRKALTDGIGREKAYGMGMLTVVHA